MENLQILLNAGRDVKDFILKSSSIIASDESVGVVVILIMIALVVSVAFFVFQTVNKMLAVGFLAREVCKSESRPEFAHRYNEFQAAIYKKERHSRANPYNHYIKRAWIEYSETLVVPDDENPDAPVRNTVRPNFFFNPLDLGFEHGIWRHLPGIFVSFGLLLTFLGIIAAINGLNEFNNESMKAFLDAAKSKFIMSLSGLAASLIFTVLYRVMTASLDKRVAYLCDEIEFRVLFHTPEQIAAEQLVALREQSAQLKVLGNDLGAQIGDSISTSLTRELGPVLDKVSNSAGTEVSGMVGQIGDALNAKLNDSLDEMSQTLSTINLTLVNVTEQLTNSGSSIGDEMSKGIKNLNDLIEGASRQVEEDQVKASLAREQENKASQKAISSLLESIENNTRENNENMRHTAESISEAAKGLAGAINGASDEVSNQAGAAIEGIGANVKQKVEDTGADIAGKLADVSSDFLSNLEQFKAEFDTSLIEPVRTMSKHLQTSNVELEKYAVSVSQATTSQEKSSLSIINSSKSLETAANPIAESVERIEKTNEAIRGTLEASLTAMKATHETVDQTMTAMQESLSNMRDIVSNAEGLDEKLGDAFHTISNGLNESQDQIRHFSEEVAKRFGDGIQSIQTVMDGMDEFKPSRQGT